MAIVQGCIGVRTDRGDTRMGGMLLPFPLIYCAQLAEWVESKAGTKRGSGSGGNDGDHDDDDEQNHEQDDGNDEKGLPSRQNDSSHGLMEMISDGRQRP